MFDSHFVFSNCSLPAFVYVFSHNVKLLTALLIGSCGRLCQVTCNASLSSLIDFGFGSRPAVMVVQFTCVWRQLVVSDEFRQLT